MLTNENMYYIVKNVQTKDGFVNFDYDIVEASEDFETISSRYFRKEQKAIENYKKSFRCYSEDNNDGYDYWMFLYNDENGDEITYVLCGNRKVRDYVTHI